MSDISARYDSILRGHFGGNIHLHSKELVAGGNINQAIRLNTNMGSFLLKTNTHSHTDIFEKEVKGLDYLRKQKYLPVPQVFCQGTQDEMNYLLMEWIVEGKAGKNYWEEMAQGLAQLHGNKASKYGLEEDNYISILPQVNSESENWTEFFIENRLEKMLAIALSKKKIDLDFLKRFRTIYPKISSFFPDEKPSLVHGDLWSGNVLINDQGLPCLIDPAVYFGHREMDLAFSQLFGGFSPRFYKTYEELFPLAPGFVERSEIYNLYPLLVHLILFGESYYPAIAKVVDKIRT
jgi:fructosamine-3-kinase